MILQQSPSVARSGLLMLGALLRRPPPGDMGVAVRATVPEHSRAVG